MCVTRDEKRLITGGADSTVNVWKDVTVEEQEKAHDLEQERVEKEQKLSNMIRRKDYSKVIAERDFDFQVYSTGVRGYGYHEYP